jgi:hypothetical protein
MYTLPETVPVGHDVDPVTPVIAHASEDAPVQVSVPVPGNVLVEVPWHE